MDQLTVTLASQHLADDLADAHLIAGRYFDTQPHHLTATNARKDHHSSNWQIQFTFTATAGEPPDPTATHQLEFRLKGFTQAEIFTRAHQHAATYYGLTEHLLVDSRASEHAGGRFTVAFTFLGLAT